MLVSKSKSGLFQGIHGPLVRLIFAHITLLFLAIYAMAMDLQNYPWPRWQSMFIEVLALSQISLLSCWCILGLSHWSVRTSILLIGVTFWVVTLRACGLNQERWLTIALIQVVGICVMLLAVQFRGYTLIDLNPGKATSTGHSEASSKLPRFSLFQLLIFVSIASLILGMSQILLSHDALTTLNRGDHIRAPGLALAVAVLAITILWTTLFVKVSFDSSLLSLVGFDYFAVCMLGSWQTRPVISDELVEFAWSRSL